MSHHRHGEREHGRILDVTEETLGTTLEGDHAAGATLLYVDDAADFEDDGSGGWLSVNDQVIQYDTVDDDAGTIHLLAGLSAAADDGDKVTVWSRLYDAEATIKTALVQVDGEDDNTDPVHATLADAVQDLPEGLRGEAGESCTLLRVSADEWEVTSISGRPTTSKGIQFYEDTLTVAAVGAQTMQLTFEPIEHSEHLYWRPGGLGGIYQGPSQFTRDGRSVSIPDTAGDIRVNDKLTIEYAYRTGIRQSTMIPFESTGWSYLLIPSSDTTDRSAPTFDDSGWSVGQAAFGAPAAPHITKGWPAPHTAWPTNTAIWLRRHITGTAAASVRVRFDDQVKVYWNGTLLDSETNNVTETGDIVVPDGLIAADNVLAIRAQDTGSTSWIDAQITLG